VILECDGVWVLLAHLRRGSVRVVAGQELQTGERLGEAGNSGNTGEPHLHIHAQTPGTADAPLAGTPLPIRIGGRYRYRNAGLAVR
jgi:murein DD-endopeptidase MepM/ murein hydrolase activator NlpD